MTGQFAIDTNDSFPGPRAGSMHSKDLLNHGESLDRLLPLTAWREAPVYTEKVRVALELTECVTHVSEGGVPDHVQENVRAPFSEKEFVDLVMAINVINCWNRLSMSTEPA